MGKIGDGSNPGRPRILILEDAQGIALMYKELLEETYSVRICTTSQAIQSLIEEGNQFDLAIVDIVLPPEDLTKFTLDQCEETGLRLMDILVAKEICHRFYVITVRSSLRDRVERLCKAKKAIVKFEAKADLVPERLLDNVANLLATSLAV